MKKVTYIVANYNYGKWIKECIGSILAQNYPKELMTVCIIDDCSTDNSVEAIEELRKENPNIVFIESKTNSGPSYSRNQGIHLTKEKTDYYMIVDADDTIHPDKTRIMVDVMNSHNSIGVVYANYYNIDVNTGISLKEYKEPFSLERLGQECIIHSGSLIRKECFLTCGMYDVTMRVAEDYDLWLRIAQKFNIVHIPNFLTNAKVHYSNSTNTVNKKVWQECLDKIRKKYS